MFQLSKNHTLQKADQTRRWATISPSNLWICWRDQHDHIGKTPSAIPVKAKNEPTFTRDLIKIYRLVLYISAADRILASHSITMDEVSLAQVYLQKYSQWMLKIGAHLTVNNHLSMHYETIFSRYGPVYPWWCYGFEQCNGDQKKVNLNGHAQGEMEATLARDWVQKHWFYELVGIFINLCSYN